MALYFAYGSNMRSARLAQRIGRARAIGAVHVSGWSLRFDKPGRDGTGKANLVEAPGVQAWGVAYAVPQGAWPRLDRFEPGYRREQFRLVASDGRTLDALAYLYPSSPPAREALPSSADGLSTLSPSPEYLAHLLDGAREHGLPDHWLETIRSAARVG